MFDTKKFFDTVTERNQTKNLKNRVVSLQNYVFGPFDLKNGKRWTELAVTILKPLTDRNSIKKNPIKI